MRLLLSAWGVGAIVVSLGYIAIVGQSYAMKKPTVRFAFCYHCSASVAGLRIDQYFNCAGELSRIVACHMHAPRICVKWLTLMHHGLVSMAHAPLISSLLSWLQFWRWKWCLTRTQPSGRGFALRWTRAPKPAPAERVLLVPLRLGLRDVAQVHVAQLIHRQWEVSPKTHFFRTLFRLSSFTHDF